MDFVCEKCGCPHNGSYGSGRFCCSKCARSYSTSKNREEINKKVSKTLKGRNGATKKQIRHDSAVKRKQDWLNIMLSTASSKYLTYPNIDFGNKYIICDNGSVYSVQYCRELKHTAYSKCDRYRRMVLSDVNNKQHIVYVHIAVAYAFIENPDNLPLVNHKDENPANNSVDNLEWCTAQYNSTYNDVHIRKGRVLSERIRANGGSKRKGVPLSESHKKALSAARKRVGFNGNQYVDKFGNKR